MPRDSQTEPAIKCCPLARAWRGGAVEARLIRNRMVPGSTQVADTRVTA